MNHETPSGTNRNGFYITTLVVLVMWGIGAPIWQAFHCAELRARTMLANETTGEFEYLSTQAISKDEGSIEESVEAIREYYPSGTKQIVGSTLDQIVERSRRQNIELLQSVKRSRELSKREK